MRSASLCLSFQDVKNIALFSKAITDMELYKSDIFLEKIFNIVFCTLASGFYMFLFYVFFSPCFLLSIFVRRHVCGVISRIVEA